MPGYLLDTNHLSPLVTLHHPLRVRLIQHIDIGTEFSISVLVLAEFLLGIQVVPRARANKIEWERFQNRFGYYEVRREDAEKAADLQVALRRKGRQLGIVDAMIAVIAIENGLTLLTTDGDFEFVPRLQYENWLKT